MQSYEKLAMLDEIIEPAGFAYDPGQNIFYSRINGWQRKYGYTKAYDNAAAHFSMIFHCEPFYFYYDNKEWLLEFWKGQYGMTTGGEVGLYYRNKVSFPEEKRDYKTAIFRAAEEEQFPLIHVRLVKKDKVLFERIGRHWWLTGFVLGEFSKPKHLVLETELVFSSSKMAQEAAKAIRESGHEREKVVLTGNHVYFRFDKPKTKQPFSQKKLFVFFKQLRNYILCVQYRKFIGSVEDVAGKLLALYKKRPKLFQKMFRMGDNRKWRK